MIVAVGTDLVDLERLERAMSAHGERFLERILTHEERAYCERRANRVQSVGARFAAKEAVMKVLGTGWAKGVRWRDIEVRRESSGRPSLHLAGVAAEIARSLGIRTIHISLTHTAEHALATAIAED